MGPIAISFPRAKNDLAVTCDLGVWRRLPSRYGYHEKDYLEIQQGIMICANVTVFCSESGFPPEGAEFPDTAKTLEVSAAVVEVFGKRLTITVKEYEQRPLQQFTSGNHGFFIQHYGLANSGRMRFDLDAWISFRLPKMTVRDRREWTVGTLGSHFESNRNRH